MQRSPALWSWPHAKASREFPSKSDPGVISSQPVAVRYWNVPEATIAIEVWVCISSKAESRGLAPQTTSQIFQPSPDANNRACGGRWTAA